MTIILKRSLSQEKQVTYIYTPMMNQEILSDVQGGVGVIVLNRPLALNALSFGMIAEIGRLLDVWEGEDGIEAVEFRGSGEKAFCAGGDVRAAREMGLRYQAGEISLREAAAYFKAEYRLNHRIRYYPKPTRARMDGIVMGGGYGIAGHCNWRIASDKTVFAMPETKIGFFPDVGGMYYLSRLKGHVGRYLAVTGNALNGADMKVLGLAEELEGGERQPLLSGHEEVIARCFAHSSVEAIMEALEAEEGAFAASVLSDMEARSPRAMAVALAYCERAKDMAFKDVIETDYKLAQAFIRDGEMFEGIRAVLVDKDHAPRWRPLGQAVGDVEAYFAPQEDALF